MWCEIVRHCVKTLEWELLRQYYTSWCNNIEILHLESLVFLTSRQRRVSQTPQPNEIWLPRQHSAHPTQPPDILFKSQRSAISVQFSGHSKTLVWYSLPGLDKWPWKSNGHVLQLNMRCPLISFYGLIILLHIQVSAGGASYCWRRRCLAWPEMEMSCMAGDGDVSYGRRWRLTLVRADGIQPYLYFHIYIGLVALLDRTQLSFSSITIWTGYEPGARYYFYLTIIKKASKTLTHSQPSLLISHNTITIYHPQLQPS